MSIIRILLGVIVGGCIVAGLLVAAVRFPTMAMFVMFGTAGGAILLVAYHGLRTGIIGAKRSRYERSAHSDESGQLFQSISDTIPVLSDSCRSEATLCSHL